MKKNSIWMTLWAICMLMMLWACQPESTGSDFAKPVTSEGEDTWGVTITERSANAGSIVLSYSRDERELDGELRIDNDVRLQMRKNEEWVDLPVLIEPDPVLALYFFENATPIRPDYPWQRLIFWDNYENLENGDYRTVVKVYMGSDAHPDEAEKKEYYNYFRVTDENRYDPIVKEDIPMPVCDGEDEWGLVLSPRFISPEGGMFTYTSDGRKLGGELQTGDPFEVSRWNGSEWEHIKSDHNEFIAIGYGIPKDGSRDLSSNFFYRYDGPLEPGIYRYEKEIMLFRKTADFDQKIYYAYFQITEDMVK